MILSQEFFSWLRPIKFGVVSVVVLRVYLILSNSQGVSDFTVSNKVLFSDAARILDILWIGKKDSQKQNGFFVYSVFCFALLLMCCYYIIKIRLF